MQPAFIVALLSVYSRGVTSLTCYWCSGVNNDRMCETRPRDVSSYPVAINCTTKYCVSAKVMDAVTGRVRSFARICDHNPRGNVCIKDSHFVTCFETCTSDLCNSGNPDPSYLRTQAFYAVYLGLPEVGDSTMASARDKNAVQIHERVLVKPSRSKSHVRINNAPNFVKKKRVLSPNFAQNRDTVPWWQARDITTKFAVNNYSSTSLPLSATFSRIEQKIFPNGGKINSTVNRKEIKLSPYSSAASYNMLQTSQNDSKNIKFNGFGKNSKSSVQKVSGFWWEQDKANQVTKDNKTEDSVHMKTEAKKMNIVSSNKILTSNKGKANDKYESHRFQRGDNRDTEIIDDDSNNYRPYTFAESSKHILTTNATTSHKPNHVVQGGLHTGSDNQAASNAKVSLSKWWDKSIPQSDNDRIGSNWVNDSQMSQSDKRFIGKTPPISNNFRQRQSRIINSQGSNHKVARDKEDKTHIFAKNIIPGITKPSTKTSNNLNNNKKNKNNKSRHNFAEDSYTSRTKTEIESSQGLASSKIVTFLQNKYETKNDEQGINAAASKSQEASFKLKPRRGMLLVEAPQPFRADLANNPERIRTFNLSMGFHGSDLREDPVSASIKRHHVVDIQDTRTASSVKEDMWYSRDSRSSHKRVGNADNKVSVPEKNLDNSEQRKSAEQQYYNKKRMFFLGEFNHNSLFPDQVSESESTYQRQKWFQITQTIARPNDLLKFGTGDGMQLSPSEIYSDTKGRHQERRKAKPSAVPYDNHPPIGDRHLYLDKREDEPAFVDTSTSSITSATARNNLFNNFDLYVERSHTSEHDTVTVQSLGMDQSTSSQILGMGQSTTSQSLGMGQSTTSQSLGMGQSTTSQSLGMDQSKISQSLGMGQSTSSQSLGMGQSKTSQSLGMGQYTTSQSLQIDGNDTIITGGLQTNGHSSVPTQILQMDEYDAQTTLSLKVGSYNTVSTTSVQKDKYDTSATQNIQFDEYSTTPAENVWLSEHNIFTTQNSLIRHKTLLPDVKYEPIMTHKENVTVVKFHETANKSAITNNGATSSLINKLHEQFPLSRGNGQLPLDPSNGHLRLEPGNGHLPPDPSNGYLPHEPGNEHLPLDPSNRHLPLDPSNGHLPLDPSNGHLPLDPSNGHLPLDPSNGHLPYEPGNGHLPPDPSNGHLPREPGNGHLPRESGNGHLSPDASNGHLPREPGNGHIPLAPGNVHLSHEPGNGHLPPDASNVHLPRESGNGHLPLDPNNGHLPFEPDNGHFSLEPDNRHLPLEPDNRHLPLEPDNRHLPLEPDNRHLPLEPDNRHLPLEPDNRHLPLEPDNGHLPLESGKGHIPLALGKEQLSYDKSNGQPTHVLDNRQLLIGQKNKQGSPSLINVIALSSDNKQHQLAIGGGQLSLNSSNIQLSLRSFPLNPSNVQYPLAKDNEQLKLDQSNGYISLATDNEQLTLVTDHGQIPLATDNEQLPLATDNGQLLLAIDNGQLTLVTDNGQLPNHPKNRHLPLNSSNPQLSVRPNIVQLPLTLGNRQLPTNSSNGQFPLNSSNSQLPLKPNIVQLPFPSENRQLPLNSSNGQQTLYSSNIKLPFNSSNGQLTLYSSNGQLPLNSSNGQLTLYSSNGQLSLNSSNGQLTHYSSNEQRPLYSSNRQLSINSSNGQLTLYSSNGQRQLNSSNRQLTLYSSKDQLLFNPSNDKTSKGTDNHDSDKHNADNHKTDKQRVLTKKYEGNQSRILTDKTIVLARKRKVEDPNLITDNLERDKKKMLTDKHNSDIELMDTFRTSSSWIQTKISHKYVTTWDKQTYKSKTGIPYHNKQEVKAGQHTHNTTTDRSNSNRVPETSLGPNSTETKNKLYMKMAIPRSNQTLPKSWSVTSWSDDINPETIVDSKKYSTFVTSLTENTRKSQRAKFSNKQYTHGKPVLVTGSTNMSESRQKVVNTLVSLVDNTGNVEGDLSDRVIHLENFRRGSSDNVMVNEQDLASTVSLGNSNTYSNFSRHFSSNISSSINSNKISNNISNDINSNVSSIVGHDFNNNISSNNNSNFINNISNNISNIIYRNNNSNSNNNKSHLSNTNKSESNIGPTNKMASGSLSSRRMRRPSQRIYLTQKVNKPGSNQKLQSEASTFTSDTNFTPELHHLTWIHMLLLLLATMFGLV